MLALKDRTKYGEKGNQDNGILEGNQSAPHRRSDAVGGIVGPDIPPYIDAGSDENEKNRFYGLPPLFMFNRRLLRLLRLAEKVFRMGYNINQFDKSNQ